MRELLKMRKRVLMDAERRRLDQAERFWRRITIAYFLLVVFMLLVWTTG